MVRAKWECLWSFAAGPYEAQIRERDGDETGGAQLTGEFKRELLENIEEVGPRMPELERKSRGIVDG